MFNCFLKYGYEKATVLLATVFFSFRIFTGEFLSPLFGRNVEQTPNSSLFVNQKASVNNPPRLENLEKVIIRVSGYWLYHTAKYALLD